MAESMSERNILEESTIVDTDIHLSIDIDQIAEYLDDPYRSHMLNPTGFPLPLSGWNRGLGEKVSDENEVRSADDIQQDLVNRFNIDYPIINATSFLPRLPQSDLAIALMRAYNDLVLDRYLDSNPNFRGLITLATQKPNKAAEEIDRLSDEDQFVGIYLATSGADRPLGDERYDPIYKAAEDNNLAVAYHASAGAFMFDFPKQNKGFEKFFEVHSMAHPWGQMMTMVSLLANGTPVKFPDLDFVFLEAGLGWIPYMMMRLNREYSMRRSEVPLLEKSPEEYIREFYFASQPVGEPNNPEHLSQIMQMVGPESICFATDYPHWDFDSPEAINKHLNAHFTPDERDKVLGENAAEAFGINI
jgi:predicted TIM-barrel fold metal-dependent hydrolase